MSFKRHKQSALPNKNYPLNANTKYNWSLRSFDWLIFERHSLPEFILVGIYETFLQLTRYHCTPTIFTAWQDFLDFSHTDRFSNQSQFTFHFFPNDLFPLCQGLEINFFLSLIQYCHVYLIMVYIFQYPQSIINFLWQLVEICTNQLPNVIFNKKKLNIKRFAIIFLCHNKQLLKIVSSQCF